MEKTITKQSNSSKELKTTPLSRPKVSIYIASSIDGYIARTDGNLDWLHYGHTGDEDYGFKKFTSSIDSPRFFFGFVLTTDYYLHNRF